MRKPRPDLFDPHHKSTRKPEDVDLSGTVPIKSKPGSEQSNAERSFERTEDRPDEPTKVRTDERTEIRTENRLDLFPKKRVTKRHSFEFFQDQLTRIKRIKIETELSGENISLSEIVRYAIDEYLMKVEQPVRNSVRQNERTNYRTEKRTEKSAT